MITEQDLQAAIAECQGERNPNANTCIKLAAYYTIKDHLFPESTQTVSRAVNYSYASEAPVSEVQIEGNSDFARLVRGRSQRDVWPLVDDLVQTIRVVNPRLYASFMRSIE